MGTDQPHSAFSPRAIALLCFLVAVLEGYDLQVISSAGPHLMRTMHLSPDKVGWFFSASLIGLAIGAIAGGYLADRIGRKPALIASVVALGIFTFATAFATSFDVLLMIRILAGIGLGGAMPTLIALMAEVAGGARTTAAVTTMICGQPTGGIISALVGKTLAETYGWQSLFLVGGALTIVAIPLLIRVLPETRPQAAALPERLSAAQALFGEKRGAGTVLLWLTFILTLALLSIFLSWTPLLVAGKGFPRPVGLNAIIAVNLGGIIGGVVISRMIDRFGMRWPMLMLYALTAISLYLLAHSQSVAMVMLMAGAAGFGILGAQFSLYGIAPQLYPAAGRGSGVGVAVALGRIGSVLGPVLVGGMLVGGMSEDQTVLTLAPFAIAAGLFLFAMTAVARLEGRAH